MKILRSPRVPLLVVIAAFMLVPLYLLVVNAFKSQTDILTNPFGLDWSRLTFEPLIEAVTSPDFNVIAAYGVTAAFVIVVNTLSLAVTIPVAYVIARGVRRWHRGLLFVLLAGLFIPGQVLVIPVIYVLKTIGLMGTLPGFVLFETTTTIPLCVFLFTAFIASIPRELDEAAKIDGAGRLRVLVTVIVPLMRPAIATAVILNTIGIWGDFVNPQIILGPGSGIYTVTTGVYYAISLYSTDYTVVYPNLLLAITPILVFFILMQKQIVGGLTSGALKG